MIRCSGSEAKEYAELEIPVTCLVARGGRLGNALWALVRRIRIFVAMLRVRRVILTESMFLIEAATAKALLGRGLMLAHFCQELHLASEMPDLPRAKLNGRLARIPDFTIDV